MRSKPSQRGDALASSSEDGEEIVAASRPRRLREFSRRLLENHHAKRPRHSRFTREAAVRQARGCSTLRVVAP